MLDWAKQQHLPRNNIAISGTRVCTAEQLQLDSQVAENLLKNIRIPPCPEVVVALMDEARQPDVDFAKLVKFISGDVGLAASILKTANSPFFALGEYQN